MTPRLLGDTSRILQISAVSNPSTSRSVKASRWAAGVVRDFILRPDSDLLRLDFVRSKPFPFPPEPLRTAAVWVMQRELARADANHGRRGPLLRAFDWFGIGFDS